MPVLVKPYQAVDLLRLDLRMVEISMNGRPFHEGLLQYSSAASCTRSRAIFVLSQSF